MKFFEINGQQLIWRNHGETLGAEPWGEDSIRGRAALMREVKDDRFALLDPAPCPEAEIRIESERKAFVRNGKITAVLEVCGWKERAKITFLNRKHEILLQETDGVLQPVALSVGVAFSDREKPEGDVFQDADTALLRTRQTHRGGCTVF